MADFRTELEHAAQELELAENALLCSSFHNSAIRVKAAARRARAALAQPEPEGFTPDHVNLMCFAFEREPWATWLRKGGCLESAHCELSDLMLAVLTHYALPVPYAEVQS
jgi:hypothetical protein